MFKPTKLIGVAALATASLLPHQAWAGAVAGGPVEGGVNEFSSIVLVEYDPATGLYKTSFYPRLFGQYININSSQNNGGVITVTTPTKTGTAVVSGLATKVGTNTVVSGSNLGTFDTYAGIITTSTDPRLKAGVAVVYVDDFAKGFGLQYTAFGIWGAKKRANSANALYTGAFAGPAPGNVFSTTMPTSGSANYTGGAVGQVNAAGVPGKWLGTLALTANFAASGGTVSGSITNIEVYQNGAAAGSLNDLALNLGSFAKKTFMGTVTPGATAGTYANLNGGTGLYKGAFYGPGAAEVAGILHVSTSNTYLTGSFGGKH